MEFLSPLSIIFIFICLRVRLCMDAYECSDRGDQKTELNPLKLELQAVLS